MHAIDELQNQLGGKLIADPYPYIRKDRKIWLMLLTDASKKNIGLYATLVYLRAAGAKLEVHKKFGYIIKPILRGEEKWGWPTMEKWEESRKLLLPYKENLVMILKNLKS